MNIVPCLLLNTQKQGTKDFQQEFRQYLLTKKGSLIQSTNSSLIGVFFLSEKLTKNIKIKFNVILKRDSIQYKLTLKNESPLNYEQKDKITKFINSLNLTNKTLNTKIYFNNQIDELQLFTLFKENCIQGIDKQNCKKYIRTSLSQIQAILIELSLKTQNIIQKSCEIVQKSQGSLKKNQLQLVRDLENLKHAIDADIRTRDQNNLHPCINYYIDHLISIPNQKFSLKSMDQTNEILSLQQLRLIDKKNGKPKLQCNKIVRKISFVKKQKNSEWKQPTSAYGSLQKLDAIYKVQDYSINNATNILLREQQQQNQEVHFETQQPENIIIGPLIEKTPSKIKKKLSEASFRTEVQILKYLRNYSDQTIASYYLQEQYTHNETTNSLYLDYYPKTIGEIQLKPKQGLYVFKILAASMKFMSEAHVLHRDLKPDNIMLNNKYIPKIIDFGSGTFSHTDDVGQICQLLKTTILYNIRYQHLPDERVMTKKQFQKHKYFDIYSYGKTLQKILISPQRTKQLGVCIVKNLNWLKSKCTEINPSNRVNQIGIYLFMKKVYEFWNISKTSKK